MNQLTETLHAVKNGTLSVEEAAVRLKCQPFEDIGYAKVDHHRSMRQGAGEVIYGAGKTPEQIAGIAAKLQEHGQATVLITQLGEEASEIVEQTVPLTYYAQAKIGLVGSMPEPNGEGYVLVATGGTSDIPVAEEAALTAEYMGSCVVRLYDVGVAGIHRTLAHMDTIMGATCIVAVAGMEGALPSVLGGLADCPVIAVPTSVGYGAAFGGVAALLGMLNSCASGVSVVNIDNGFGAGYLAGMIDHIGSISK